MSQPADADRLHIHHVGGRTSSIDGQGFPVSLPMAFMPDTNVYLYEADSSCIEQIYNMNRHLPVNLKVLTCAVAAQSGRADFHIGRDRYASSLLEPNERFGSMYSVSNTYGDYVYGECQRAVETLSMEAVSIDDLVRSDGVQVDFFSTDADGADHELLLGARRTLGEDAVGFSCETELVEYRKSTKHLGHIIDLAESLGYRLMRYDSHGDFYYYRAPIGWRGTGSNIIGDALFLKEIVPLTRHPHAARQLRKLAFFALCFGLVEYALEALKMLNLLPKAQKDEERRDLRYIDFLERVHSEYRESPKVFPPSFIDCFSAEDAKAFNAPDVTTTVMRHSTQATQRRYLQQLGDVERANFVSNLNRLGDTEFTPFEKLLHEHGFQRQADKVRERRISTLRVTLRVLGLSSD